MDCTRPQHWVDVVEMNHISGFIKNLAHAPSAKSMGRVLGNQLRLIEGRKSVELEAVHREDPDVNAL
jgi:hypothetical protein